MTYRVELTTEVATELADLSEKIQRQIARRLDALAENPRPPQAKRLSNAEHLYRVRSGDYRILYQVGDDVLMVLVVRIRHRRDVYRRLPAQRPMPEE